jgi:hypothetical protein
LSEGAYILCGGTFHGGGTHLLGGGAHSCERKLTSSLWEVPISLRGLLHLLRRTLGSRGRKGEVLKYCNCKEYSIYY